MNLVWACFAAIVASATSYETGSRFAREYGLPGESTDPLAITFRNLPAPFKAKGAREGRYIPLPPGAKVYFAHPGIPRLFKDVDSAVAGLPDGNYKLFYTPAVQSAKTLKA